MDPHYRIRHVLALVLCVFTCLLLLVNPALSRRLIDDVIVAQNPDPLLSILGVMLVVKLGREGLRYLMVITLEKGSQNAVYNLRRRLFAKLQYNDMHFFDSHRTGDLMTRMSADLDWCRHFLSYIDYRIVDAVCTFLFSTIYLCLVNWKLPLLKASTLGALVVNISSEAGSIGRCYRTFYLDYGTEKAALNMLTMTLHNWLRDEPNLNIICIHPGWIRTNPGNTEAPLDPYEHAETLRLLLETRRHDKEGPVFVTYEGEPYPW